jgi:uncharacterized membrane protein
MWSVLHRQPTRPGRVRPPGPLPPAAALLAATAVVLPMASLVHVTLVRASLVLPLALVVPGYGLLVAAFGPGVRFDPAPAAALSALTSAALYPLLTLVLYAAGIPLSLSSALWATDVALLALAAVIVIRGRRAVTAASVWVPGPAAAGSGAAASPWRGAQGCLLFVGAVAITLAAIAVAVRVLPSPVDEPYTQFHLRGRWANVNTVVRAQPDRPLAVEVAVVNRTHRRQSYRLVPRLSGGRGWAPRTVTLAPGRRWAGSVGGTLPKRGCLHRLALVLREVGGHRSPERVLTVWVRSSAIAPRRCRPS